MYNPCNECIVNAMCQEGCDKLERYIYKRMDPSNSRISTYFMLADDVRKGLANLESMVKQMEAIKNDQSM
jgi:sulfatase maturation enzyme AslB (radical SAM superfamily)